MSEELNRERLVNYSTPIESDQKKVKGITGKKRTQLPPMESKPDMESILNAILPPREWEHEGKHYIQYVSHTNGSRTEVANLQKLLDERLLAR